MKSNLLIKRFAMPSFIALLALTIGCQKEQAPMETHVPKEEQPPSTQELIQNMSSKLNMKAFTEEEKITRLLQEMAKSQQGKLKGLEHRFKTESSTLRKLKKINKLKC